MSASPESIRHPKHMKKIPLFLMIARLRMLSLFRSYFDKLQSRITLVAGITLCMIAPMSLAAYYQTLSTFKDPIAWAVVSMMGIALISIHGKLNPDSVKILAFEKTLPISTGFRFALDYLDSFWIQLPVILFILLGAVTDRFDFHNHQPWLIRFQIMGATMLVLMTNLHIARLLERKRFIRFPVFYVNASIMKIKAILKNYPSFSQMTLVWIALLSFVGGVIARLPKSDQPRLFLYFLFFGLQVLPLSKIPALLADWDGDLRPYLNTLPRKSDWTSAATFVTPATLLLIQGAIWVALSFSQPYLLISFMGAAILSAGLFYLLQMRFAKWALMVGFLITLTGATALQASVK
jgi:hypothetical protein